MWNWILMFQPLTIITIFPMSSWHFWILSESTFLYSSKVLKKFSKCLNISKALNSCFYFNFGILMYFETPKYIFLKNFQHVLESFKYFRNFQMMFLKLMSEVSVIDVRKFMKFLDISSCWWIRKLMIWNYYDFSFEICLL